MPNILKRLGDAVLCRDGNVKVGGRVVGVWWEGENDLYQFALAKGQAPVVTDILRHTLKAAIPGYLRSKGAT